jgi:hypothetical protein
MAKRQNAAGERSARALSVEERLALFDAATERQARRQREKASAPAERGWKRPDVYDRSRSR